MKGRALTKELSDRWKNLSEDEKLPYKEAYDAEHIKYEAEKKAWGKQSIYTTEMIDKPSHQGQASYMLWSREYRKKPEFLTQLDEWIAMDI